jgi:hypothetical protein
MSAAVALDPIEALVVAAIDDELPEFYKRAVARAAQAGQFVWDEGLAALERIMARRAAARPPAAPRSSPRDRPWQDAGCRYVPELGLDATLNVRGTAHPLLSLIASLAGRAGSIETLTVSLAKALGVGRRCVQYAYHTLEGAGLIARTWNRRTGVVTLTILPAALPRQPDPVPPAAPWPVPPTPSQIWIETFRARCARLRASFRPKSGGGAQRRAPIKRQI